MYNTNSLYNKLQALNTAYRLLDLDHPQYYSNRDTFVYTFSTYNRTPRMTRLFQESGFVSIPPVYRVDCNSWLYITNKRSNELKPLWTDIRR